MSNTEQNLHHIDRTISKAYQFLSELIATNVGRYLIRTQPNVSPYDIVDRSSLGLGVFAELVGNEAVIHVYD